MLLAIEEVEVAASSRPGTQQNKSFSVLHSSLLSRADTSHRLVCYQGRETERDTPVSLYSRLLFISQLRPASETLNFLFSV